MPASTSSRQCRADLAKDAAPGHVLVADDRSTHRGATNARVIAFNVISTNPPTTADAGGLPAGAFAGRRGRRLVLDAVRRRQRRPWTDRGRAPGSTRRWRSRSTGATSGAVPDAARGLADDRAARRAAASARDRLRARARAGARPYAAGMLARRLLRLETAAERIAGGDFDPPIVDRGDDEIGELARAFDRMRVQLAQLDNAPARSSSPTRRTSCDADLLARRLPRAA